MSTRAPPHPADAGRIDDALLARLARLAAAGDGPREGIEVTAPFTGEVLGTVPRTTPGDVRRAAERARAAGREWAERPVRDRARVLFRLHDLVLDRREEAQDLIQLEAGKARLDAFEEVADVAVVARYYAVHGPGHLRPRRRRGAVPSLTATREIRRPVGVVGIISPWNYPLSLALSDALPALLAGNAVVLKPDPRVSFSALWAAAALREAGLPPEVFQVVTGEGPELGPPLIDSVDHVSFTGSTRTGRVVGRRAAERLIGCSLELGGKNPMVVFEDADLDHVVEGALRGCFASAGQLCISLERVYVHASLFDEFAGRLARRAARLRLGAGIGWGYDVGPLASAAQLEKVSGHVEDAVAKGASLLTGGRARPDIAPYSYEPTLLTDVREGMALFGEETFGPVVSLYPFRTAEEALERANAGPYGLSASVWTRDRRFGRRFAARLRAGTVNVNDAYAAGWASVDAPMGGVGDSGVGRRHGREGILAYTEAQTIAVQRFRPLVPPAWMGPERWAALLGRFLRLLRRIPGLR